MSNRHYTGRAGRVCRAGNDNRVGRNPTRSVNVSYEGLSHIPSRSPDLSRFFRAIQRRRHLNSPKMRKSPPPQKLLAAAARSSRVGDFEAALKTLEELGRLLPGDPSVLMRKALVLERLEQPAEAVVVLEEILKDPGLPPDVRSQAQAKRDQLAQSLASTGNAPRDVAPPLPGLRRKSSVGRQTDCTLRKPSWIEAPETSIGGIICVIYFAFCWAAYSRIPDPR